MSGLMTGGGGVSPTADSVVYDIVPLTLMTRANPAANTTGQAATVGSAGGEIVLPAGATLVGITVWFSGAHTLGTCTVRARKNGSGDSTLVATSGTSDTKWRNTGTGATFAAGDSIGAECDTNAAWNGTSGTLNIILWLKVAKF